MLKRHEYLGSIFKPEELKRMDIILYNIIIGFACLILGYFFGSIPSGVILCKCFYHKDPRQYGSGNSGGTNVGRIFGKKMGLLVIFLDGIKTILPMLIVYFVFKYSELFSFFKDSLGTNIWNNGIFYIYLAPLGACIGHCYPIFANFNGGKAVASYAGFGLSTSWFTSLIGFATFGVVLKSTKYVSLSSILASLLGSIAAWIIFVFNLALPNDVANIFMWGCGNFLLGGWEYALVSTLISILLIVRHIPNIKRLKNHCENKVKWIK